MTLKKIVFILLAMLLTISSLYAESVPSSVTKPGATQPVVPAVDASSIQALKNMGDYLQTLHRFQVKTEVSRETVLADGQKLQFNASAQVDVQRPNKLRVLIWSARAEREMIYDGKTVTLYTPALKYYSSAETADTIHGMQKQLKEKYGVDFPLVDLFVWGTADAPIDKIESAINAGQDIIGEELCDHYVFRQGTIDWQIWVSAGDRPLPRKLVITKRDDEARPQSVSLLNWNLKPTFKDSVFKFTPPKDAKLISIRPLIKNTGGKP
jgi:hypothetical protein